MKRQFLLIIFISLVIPNYGNASGEGSFTLKGIGINAQRGSLDSISRFECKPNHDNPEADELCTSMSTFGKYPTNLWVWLYKSKVIGVMVIYKNIDHAVFFADVLSAATLKYGKPANVKESADGKIVTWTNGSQKYNIIHGVSSNMVVITLVELQKESSIEKDI